MSKYPKFLYHLTNDKEVLSEGLRPEFCKQCKFVKGTYLTDDLYVAYNYRFLDEDKDNFFIIQIPFDKLNIKFMYPDDYELFDLIDENYPEILKKMGFNRSFGNEKQIWENLNFIDSLKICNQIIYTETIKPNIFSKVIKQSDINDKNLFSLIEENILNKFKNHYNSLESLKKEDLPNEVINKFPEWLDLNDNDYIYSGVDSERNFNNHWTFDSETAFAFSKNYDNGKVIKMKVDDLINKFDFVSIDYLNEFIEKELGDENHFYVSESEIFILNKKGLNENLNLKSRVNDIKKDREELINGIFNKGVENLNKEDFIIIERLDEEKRFYLELKKYLDTLNIPSVLTSLVVEGMILNISGHFFLKLFYGKLKLWLISRIKNEKLSNRFFDLPITHKVEQDFRYLNFNNTKDLIEVLELLNDYTINEGLNLKSRAKDIEKEKEEYINNILSKGVRNLSGNDFAKIIELDDIKKELFFNELIKEFGEDFNYQKDKNGINFDVSGKFTKGKGYTVNGKNLRFNKPQGIIDYEDIGFSYSYNTLERRNLSNGVSYTAPKRIFDSVKTFDELIKKGHEILNKPMVVENLKLKSRSKEQLKDAVEYYSEQINKDFDNLSSKNLPLTLKYAKKFDIKPEIYNNFDTETFKKFIKIRLNNGYMFKINEFLGLDNDKKEIYKNELKHRTYSIPKYMNESRQEKFTTFANKVAEKMGIDGINYLDSGFFGSAFDIGDNKILKITTDKSEALNAKKVKGKNTHFIAKVYDVRGFNFEGVEYYFIILEKVQTDFEYLNGIIENLISWFDENNDEDFVNFITGSEFENLKEIEVDLYNDNKQLYNYFTNFVELKKELIKYNITSPDFINGTNLGFRGKRIVAFDLGISDDDGELENFDLFEGINLRSRAKDIEKEKEELSKEILQKNIEDFTKNDVKFLISTDNFENFLGKLKLYFDEFFKNEKHESLIKSSGILPVLKLKFIDRPRMGYNNILHIGFDILFKNQFYVEKFDGIGVDSGRYFDNITELLDYVKDTYKKKIYESLNLKSKAKEHEKEGLNFYINKIKGNETFYYIPENIFKNLPDNVKLKYIDKMVNEVGYRLYQNEFDDSPDHIKVKYIEMIKDKGWNLSKYEKKWVEFNNSSDEDKIKNIKKIIDNGLSLTEFQKRWSKENKEKFNFEIRDLMKLHYPDWFTNNSLKEGLNLKSRAKDNKEELFSFLREEGINDYTLTFLDNKNYKYNDLPKDIQLMIFSFFEGLMEVLHRENDMNFLRRSINKFFPIWIFKLLPDEFKEDIIDFMIKCDMGLTKTHFENATDSQKDFYIEKVLEFRELYSWEKEYENNKYFKERGINESLNLKSRASNDEHNKERKEYYLKKFEGNSLGYSNESIPKDLINDRKIFKEYLNYLTKHDFDMLDREFFYLNDEFKIIYLNKKKEIGKRLLPHEIRWMKKMDIKEGINLKSRAGEINKEKEEIVKDILNGKDLYNATPEQRIKLMNFEWTTLRPYFLKIKEIYGEKNLISGKYYNEEYPNIIMKIGNNVMLYLSGKNGLFTLSWSLKQTSFENFDDVLKKLEEISKDYPYYINI